MINEGDFAEFVGYQSLDSDVTPILEQGQNIIIEKIIKTDEGLAYNVRPVFVDGSINKDADGDQLFEDEFVLKDIEEFKKSIESGEFEADKEVAMESAEKPKKHTVSKGNGSTEPDKEVAMDHDPIVNDLIRSTNNLTELAYRLYEQHEELYYKLGGLLVDLKNNNIHEQEGYDKSAEGFIEYVKDFIGPKKRTTYYLMATYKRLREAGLTYKDLAGVGWTKARLLKDIQDNDELKEYLEKAKHMSRAELEAELQERREQNGAIKRQRFSFSFQEDIAQLLNQALDHAMDLVGEDKNRALELIITHYLVTEIGVKPVMGNGEYQKENMDAV